MTDAERALAEALVIFEGADIPVRLEHVLEAVRALQDAHARALKLASLVERLLDDDSDTRLHVVRSTELRIFKRRPRWPQIQPL